jgi:hypothetical protein
MLHIDIAHVIDSWTVYLFIYWLFTKNMYYLLQLLIIKIYSIFLTGYNLNIPQPTTKFCTDIFLSGRDKNLSTPDKKLSVHLSGIISQTLYKQFST